MSDTKSPLSARLVEPPLDLEPIRRRLGKELAGGPTRLTDDITELLSEVGRLQAGRLVDPSPNEGIAFQRLSQALTNGNASTWDELFHAAESLLVNPSPLAQTALRLAKEATNGWACYAKRKIEHDGIAQLHREIEALRAALLVPMRTPCPCGRGNEPWHWPRGGICTVGLEMGITAASCTS